MANIGIFSNLNRSERYPLTEAASDTIKEVVIRPGQNEVTAGQFNDLQNQLIFSWFLKRGEFVVNDSSAPPPTLDYFDTLRPDQIEKIRGQKGDKGDKGEQGERGPAGLNGRDGTDGRDGQNGADGWAADVELQNKITTAIIEKIPNIEGRLPSAEATISALTTQLQAMELRLQALEAKVLTPPQEA